MPKFKKKPVVIDAHQWFKNGDHPGDGVGEKVFDPFGGEYTRQEGRVVRFYRHPDWAGTMVHADMSNTKRPDCQYSMHEHGWIDTLAGGHTVCPSDWIITGIAGEVYPCERHIFADSYEKVED